MRTSVRCAEELIPLFDAMAAGDTGRVRSVQETIFELEGEADQTLRKLVEHLPRSLFMPVNRRDFLDVLETQDSIADTVQDIAGLVVDREMTIPEGMAPALKALVASCVDVCQYAGEVIEHMDELLETGFSGREATTVDNMLTELNTREDASDECGREAARALYALENALNPIDVMMWDRIIHWLGTTADHAERVGNGLRLLIAR